VLGEQVTGVVGTVTWQGGAIEPGEFAEFGFSARPPDEPGTLEFPAIQTYDSGEMVRWIAAGLRGRKRWSSGKLWRRWDSNPRPPACKAGALAN
jgi:Domain of unkown function (DUF1775)